MIPRLCCCVSSLCIKKAVIHIGDTRVGLDGAKAPCRNGHLTNKILYYFLYLAAVCAVSVNSRRRPTCYHNSSSATPSWLCCQPEEGPWCSAMTLTTSAFTLPVRVAFWSRYKIYPSQYILTALCMCEWLSSNQVPLIRPFTVRLKETDLLHFITIFTRDMKDVKK